MTDHGHHSVDRIDRILDVVARAPEPLRLVDIIVATRLPRSTVADLVGKLRDRGYLQRAGSRYTLGRRPQVLGLLAKLAPPTPISHDRLQELSRLAGTPLALAALVGSEVLYLDHAGPRAIQRLQRIADGHLPRPALRTAAGRLLLSFSDPVQRATVLGIAGSRDPQSVAAFLREMPAIQRSGMARSDGLADPSVRAIALPVYDRSTVTAALVLLGPRSSSSTAEASLALDQAAARVLAAAEGA